MTSYPITTPAIEYYRDALEQLEHLLGGLMHEETQRMTHGEVETLVQTEGGELLRRMIQGHFDQRSAEEPIRERVVGEDGLARPHHSRIASKNGFRVLLFLGFLTVPGIAGAEIRFQDVTDTAGPFHRGESWGASWGDFNGDDWPDLYVNNHRMPDSIYRNNRNGSFSNVTSQVDLSGTMLGQRRGTRDTHGGTWVDFDTDGDQDLLVLGGSCCETQFFLNGGGTFTLQTTPYGLSKPAGRKIFGRTPIWLDYDRDGSLDVIITDSSSPAMLMKQVAGGRFGRTFVDRTSEAALTCPKSQYAQLADLTGDDRLELICTPEGTFPGRIFELTQPRFTPRTSILPNVSLALDSALADFNGDLKTDVFVVRGRMRPSEVDVGQAAGQYQIEAQLGSPGEKGFTFRNNGTITLSMDRAEFALGQIFIGRNRENPTRIPFSLSVNDPDARGIKAHNPNVDKGLYIGLVPDPNQPGALQWQVLHSPGRGWSLVYLLVSSGAAISNLKPSGLASSDRAMPPALLVSSATGYREQAGSRGLGAAVSCASAAAGDFDNDIDVDLYMVCRSGVRNLPNILYENRGDGTFVRVPNAGGAGGVTGLNFTDQAGTSENVVVADYNLDGFLDLFVTNGMTMQPTESNGGPDQLFRNLGNTNNSVELDLVGRASNKDAIGAKVIAMTPDGKRQLREQNGGYHRWSQHHQRIHFGLGTNRTVTVQVHWPNGALQTYGPLAANALYRVTEGGSIQGVSRW